MGNYYIKYIWGDPHYPGDDGRIHFCDKSSAERFANSEGFLLYETGHNPEKDSFGGSKTIYARGVVRSGVGEESNHPTDPWHWYVEVDIEKRVLPMKGVPLKEIRDILGLKERATIQRLGGLYKITGFQFKMLKEELEKC